MSGDKALGKVLAILLYREKGMPGKSVKSVLAEETWGLEGDWHKENQERQITILPREARQGNQEGFCLKKFKENIQTAGIDFSRVRPGDQIRIGETVIQVTGTLKKCYPEICSLAARKEHCSLKEQCVFGMILRSGRICIGDEVEILEKDPAGKMTEDPELKIDKTSL